MKSDVEKLLYSRRDTAQALSLSVRSIDYLITAGRLSAHRVGGKILIPASAVRRFAREDHPDAVRSAFPQITDRVKADRDLAEQTVGPIGPRREGSEKSIRLREGSRA